MPPELRIKANQPTGIQVVESFFEALQTVDFERALALLSDDIEYQNVPLPTNYGKAQVERTLRSFMRIANEFEVRMHNIAERGGIVLTERTDILRGPFVDLRFWVCGTFEVRDGKIVLWRDRFDVGAFLFQLLTSPLRRFLRARYR
jgi:limonene-1,2-epoxide hydrolase